MCTDLESASKIATEKIFILLPCEMIYIINSCKYETSCCKKKKLT